MTRYALVIGIAEYTGSFKSLKTPVNNANAIANLLEQHGGFRVMRLPFRRERDQKDLGDVISKPLTCDELNRELKLFLQQANDSDVLIYYSGHGFTKFSKTSDTSEGCLAPSDCKIELDAEKRVVSTTNEITLSDLNKLINKHKFSSLVVILDCCNSGAFLESESIRADLKAFGYQRDYYLITACRSSSKSYEGIEDSLLAAAILKGLDRENASRSGRISGDSLFNVVGEELNNSRQEPLRMGWGRWMTLVHYHDLPSNSQEAAQPIFDPANPYVGLKAFEPDQADYFHGRERAVRALLDRLNDNRFLAVIGPSGCGKSSLVKAGLLPELEADRIPGSHKWVVAAFTPGRDPLTVLSDAFSHPPAADQTIVLFIDQFEELFTLCDNEDVQRQFIKRLHEETSKPDQQTRVILTMRGDFLDRCAKFQEAADLINTQVPTTYVVTPLTGRELAEAIAQPALMHGATFADGLVDKILEDVADQQGALPLLQYALFELWKGCIENGNPSRYLTAAGYAEIGGVKGALQRRADKLYQEGFTDQERTLFWELMRELVEVSEEKATRRRANRNQLPHSLLQIARKLADQRLLMIDNATVEVAHEALLSEWSLLRDWIEENRDNIHLSRRLELDCQEWLEKSQSNDYLLTGGRLSAIEEWVEKNQPNLPHLQVRFLKKSVERRNKELQTQLDQERKLREEAEARAIAEIEKKLEAEARAEAEAASLKESRARVRAEKRRSQLAAISGMLIAFLISAIGLTWIQAANKEAKTAKMNEISNLIVLAKKYSSDNDQLETLIISIKALRKLREVDSSNNQVIGEVKSLISNVHEFNRLEGHQAEVTDVSFSPNGELIASASWDKTVKLWDKDGKFRANLDHAKEDGVWDIEFSPNGKLLAAADSDGITKLWNMSNKTERDLKPEKMPEKDDSVVKVSFSGDGKKIASSNWDKIIRIWRVNDGKIIRVIKDKTSSAQLYGISFSIDGRILATSSKDATLKLWSIANGKLLQTLKGNNDLAFTVNFSPDGRNLASGSKDKTIRLWDVSSGNVVNTLVGHEDEVNGINFSRDGQLIASGSKDKTVRVWRISDGKLMKIFRGHKASVNAVNFSPDRQFVISASDDKTVRVWSTSSIDASSNDADSLIINSCRWLKNYLRYSTTVNESDRSVCGNL